MEDELHGVQGRLEICTVLSGTWGEDLLLPQLQV